MKRIFLLHFIFVFILFSFFYFNIENVFALQIKNVHIGNSSSDRWIEVFNDSDDITDFTTAYKLIDNSSDSKRTIYEMSNNNTILKNDTIFIYKTLSPTTTISKSLPSDANILFRSGFVLDSNNGYISIIKADDSSVVACSAYGSISCPQISSNSSNAPVDTQDQTSATSSSSSSDVVYIYLPSNNQNKYGDISVLLPEEKIIPAGADSEFNVKAIDQDKKAITGLDFEWSFGDGGEKFGQKVDHHYTYPGEYTLVASADGYAVGGEAKMNVKVVTPDISISKVGAGAKENFIDLTNNTDYDLVLSNFYLDLDSNFYKLPKNFTILKRKTVHVSGEAAGFNLPATNISLHYPNKNLLVSYTNNINNNLFSSSSISELDIVKDELDLSLENISKTSYPQPFPKEREKVLPLGEDLGGDKKESQIETAQPIKESFILKRLILDKGNNKESTRKPEKLELENLNKSKNVDTGIIDWFKSLIY